MPSTKNANPILPGSPNALSAFFLASRPKTWIASLSPVFIGTAMAPHVNYTLFALTFLFSLFIQIGTNFANDYFDFINGADTHLRNGPKRATLEGWISPQTMKMATFLIFIAALVVAIPLMIQAGLWSLFLALACVAFGILYTGGPKPLGYIGLGEILVLIFFGPVATCGTYFLQTGSVTLPVFIASLAPGLLSCSIIIANNLRDEKSDKIASKNTLIVRWGRTFGCWEYLFCIFTAALIPLILVLLYGASPNLLTASLIFLLAIPSIRKVFHFRDPLELISVLKESAILLFIYTALFCYLW
ncbi:MAG: 1,4-dihydroxy-2-naphthoate octaprenyltransferase [Chlamydiae bacterium CG10_big_fil_rev_8_21_14_0_10_42_34]|nr:MAG: 1,4-dihydroxy-2-naphthoate octaprenyltransferase [Chlamydiae bacterium CG10_big_fil_rev_8_21_14_0_10_42_34]